MNASTILIVVLGVVAVLILLPFLWMALMMGGMMGAGGMGGMMGPGGMMGQPGGMMGSGWWMLLGGLLLVVGVVLLVAWAVRRAGRTGTESDGDSALATLQRRYARGEINAEEYERIRSDLVRDRALR